MEVVWKRMYRWLEHVSSTGEMSHSTEPERESKTEWYSIFVLLLNLQEHVFTLSTYDPTAWPEFPRTSLVIIIIS